MGKLRRTLYELYKGKKAYLKSKGKKKLETTRTKAVKSGLKKSGLTDEEIAKLQGKKSKYKRSK